MERLPHRLGGHLRQRGGRADGAGEEEHDTYEEQDGDRKAHCALHGEAVTSDGQTLGGPPGSQQQAEIWGAFVQWRNKPWTSWSTEKNNNKV